MSDPSSARIPVIETETAEQRADKEARAREGAKRAAMDAHNARAATVAAQQQLSDMLRQVCGGVLHPPPSALLDSIADRRGRQHPSTIPCAIIRANPAPMSDPNLPAPPLFAVERTTADRALGIGLCDATVYFAPDMGFLAHPALPAILTVCAAMMAIVAAPKVDAEPVRRAPINEPPRPDAVTVREVPPSPPVSINVPS